MSGNKLISTVPKIILTLKYMERICSCYTFKNFPSYRNISVFKKRISMCIFVIFLHHFIFPSPEVVNRKPIIVFYVHAYFFCGGPGYVTYLMSNLQKWNLRNYFSLLIAIETLYSRRYQGSISHLFLFL